MVVQYTLFLIFNSLQAMKREIALRELKLLDAVRRKFLNHQEKVQTVEIQRLDDELERKVRFIYQRL